MSICFSNCGRPTKKQSGGILIQIKPTSNIPIYTQLSSQLIELIARGHLKGDDALPSVRLLASDLSINMHTVNKSYHELKRKGIIRIVPKSGAIINPPVQDGISKEHHLRIVEEMKPIIAEAIVLGMNTEEVLQLASSILSHIKDA